MNDQNFDSHAVMNWEHAVEYSGLDVELFRELAQLFLEEAPKLS